LSTIRLVACTERSLRVKNGSRVAARTLIGKLFQQTIDLFFQYGRLLLACGLAVRSEQFEPRRETGRLPAPGPVGVFVSV
jgi:hypothetical protein